MGLSRVSSRTVKTTLFALFTCTLARLCPAADAHVDSIYPWGRIRSTARSAETVPRDGAFWLILRTDVLADLDFNDGGRFLLATGRLEINQQTGDFIATDWPFLYAVKEKKDLHFASVDVVSAIQRQGGKLRLVTTAKSTLGGEPEIMRRRRQQLDKLKLRRPD